MAGLEVKKKVFLMTGKSKDGKNHQGVTGRIPAYGASDLGPESFRKKMREY